MKVRIKTKECIVCRTSTDIWISAIFEEYTPDIQVVYRKMFFCSRKCIRKGMMDRKKGEMPS